MKKISKKKKDKLLLIINTFIALLIIFFIPIVDLIYYSDYYLNRSDYKEVYGTVYSKELKTYHSKITTHRTYYTFRYIIKGKVFYHRSHMWGGSKELKINKQERIFYNVNKPEKAYSEFELHNMFRNLLYILSSIIFIPLFIAIVMLLLPKLKK